MATRKQKQEQDTKTQAHQDGGRTKNRPVPAQSWADRVRVSDATTRYKLQQLERQPTGTRLVITEDTLLDNSEQWMRSMVGFFPEYKMPFHAAKSIARRAWTAHGLEQVMAMDNGFLIFRFRTEEDLQGVIAKGPWMFGGKHIALQQWHPHFQFDRNNIKTMPVWVRLYGLPFPLWSTEGLSQAASMVGRPLSCDEATFHGTRLDYARMCVEVTAGDEFVHHFELEMPSSTSPCMTKPITDTGSSQAGKTTTTAGHKAREEATRSDEGGQTVGKIAANPIVQSIDSSQSRVLDRRGDDLAETASSSKLLISDDDPPHPSTIRKKGGKKKKGVRDL
ncbi:hypothetical protein OIU78_002814 [Salix suchowensis]|nr:hypothetical protein OIU78_002814 [Salix suchowensis]